MYFNGYRCFYNYDECLSAIWVKSRHTDQLNLIKIRSVKLREGGIPSIRRGKFLVKIVNKHIFV